MNFSILTFAKKFIVNGKTLSLQFKTNLNLLTPPFHYIIIIIIFFICYVHFRPILLI